MEEASSLDVVVDDGHSSLVLLLPISWVLISSVVNAEPDNVVKSTLLSVVVSRPFVVSPTKSSVVWT